jgi:hypothetical protein
MGERAGLSLDGWFWNSQEAGIYHIITSIILRAAHTYLHIRENLLVLQAGTGGFGPEWRTFSRIERLIEILPNRIE